MKFIYLILIPFYLLSCQSKQLENKAKENKEEKKQVVKPKEIKNQQFYNSLLFAISVAENNHLTVENISSVFTTENLYIFISEGNLACLIGDYQYIPVQLNDKKYNLIFENEDQLLAQNMDIFDMIYVPLNDENYIHCDEIKGYMLRFKKDDVGNYILRKLSFYDEDVNDFILEEDEKFFPKIKLKIPEPESEFLVEERS